MLLARILLALAIVTLNVSPSPASALSSPHILISELMAGTSVSASQEFIELYNPGSSAVGLAGWTLEYKSATAVDTATSWTRKASLTGQVLPHGFYLVAPQSFYPLADADWTAGLALAAGHVRLKNAVGEVVDLIGYGSTANAPETAAAAAPSTDQSIERLPGRVDPMGGNGIDTDNNSLDFLVRASPEPQNSLSLAEFPGEAQIDQPGSGEEPDMAPTYLPLEITELLPDPVTPLTDSKDEFIELYNPNSTAVDAQGYQLQTGSDFHDHYTLPSLPVPAGGYATVYSAQSGLSLVNGGGAVRILDPDGALLDLTSTYSKADPGNVWAKFDEGWRWTLQTTPGKPNVLVAPLITSSAKTAQAATKKKAASTKKTSAKTAAKKASTKSKVKKAVKAKAPILIKSATEKLQPARWLIIGLGVLTIGYAIYEFRHDARNYYYRLKSHFGLGPDSGDRARRRRDD